MARLSVQDSILKDMGNLEDQISDLRNNMDLNDKVKKTVLKIDMELWKLQEFVRNNNTIFVGKEDQI